MQWKVVVVVCLHAWDDGVALGIYARRLTDRYASCAVRHKLPRHITASTGPWQARAAAAAAVVAAAADAVLLELNSSGEVHWHNHCQVTRHISSS